MEQPNENLDFCELININALIVNDRLVLIDFVPYVSQINKNTIFFKSSKCANTGCDL